MPENAAVMFVKDGVLLDKLPENLVAFGVACLESMVPGKLNGITLEDLINHALRKSGLPFAEKLDALNSKKSGPYVKDTKEALDYYNLLVKEATRQPRFFPYTDDLLRELKACGVKNVLSSAASQELVDEWMANPDNSILAAYLDIALGNKADCKKGSGHFRHVFKELGVDVVYYIADAQRELKTAYKCADRYNVVPIGIANVITFDRLLEAFGAVLKAKPIADERRGHHHIYLDRLLINPKSLMLPDEHQTIRLLQNAGAREVITAENGGLMLNLKNYFVREGLMYSK